MPKLLSRSDVTNIDEYLQRDPQMARLADHAARLLRLRNQLAVLLPEPLFRAVRVANLKDGRLLLFADHGAVAARLRQQTPSLTQALRVRGGEVTGIDVRVQPRRFIVPSPKPMPALAISPHGRRALTALAERLPAASPLKQALERLLHKTE